MKLRLCLLAFAAVYFPRLCCGMSDDYDADAAAVASSSTSQTELCNHVKDNPIATEQELAITIAPWLKQKHDEWRSEKASGASRLGFYDALRTKYAPRVSSGTGNCNLSDKCSIVGCDFIHDEYDLEEQKMAYYSLESITNFHSYKWHWHQMSESTFHTVSMTERSLVDKYTDATAIKKKTTDQQVYQKLMMHVVSGIMNIIQSELAVGGNVLDSNPLKTNGALLGAYVAATKLAFNIVTDLKKPTDYVEKITSEVSKIESDSFEIAKKLFVADTNAILSGETGITDKTIVDVIATGKYASLPSSKPEDVDVLEKLWKASWISNLWNSERSYIIMANTDDCDGDSRGPEDLKACISDLSEYVFYLYHLPHDKQSKHEYAEIAGPPGYESIEEEANITVSDVIHASVDYYRKRGNGISLDTKVKDEFDNLFDASPINSPGGRAANLFNVPVCYTPNGMGISVVEEQNGKRFYPCMCADVDWTSKRAQSGKRDSLSDRRHHRLPKDTFENSVDEAFNFLSATGLYTSEGFRGFCRDEHQKCDAMKGTDWENKFGEGQTKKLMHPFKNCRGAK